MEKMVRESKGINRNAYKRMIIGKVVFFLFRVFLVDMVKIKAALLNRMFNVCRVLTNVLPFADHKCDYLWAYEEFLLASLYKIF